ncbi:MAG: lipocalin-like domain-containing protein [Simkania sp.]|nr:lipocalin-like domain-containing protein [Simkania sp.]
MPKSKLLGAWKLVSCSINNSDGVTYPYGKDAIGYIIYTPDNVVSVHMMSASRMYASQHQFRSGTDAEKIEAAENFGGYVGRYEVSGDVVTHFPEACGFPSFINVPQKRKIDLSGNVLTLSCTDPSGQNESIVVWERVDAKG